MEHEDLKTSIKHTLIKVPGYPLHKLKLSYYKIEIVIIRPMRTSIIIILWISEE